MTIRLLVALCLFASVGCASPPPPLTSSGRLRLSALRTEAGPLIYEGTVAAQGGSEPLFRYERRVAEHGGGLRSTHLTYDLAGEIVVAQRAAHDAAYRLTSFEEVHRQTGVVSRLHVAEDGSLRFEVQRGDELREVVEGPGDPVVVGPTLFGYTLAHWDELLAGETLAVRFAATERGESFGFTLQLQDQEDSSTTIAFTASSAFVRLVMDPMLLVFDAEGGAVLRYQGRVPPRRDGTDELDADVDYRMVAAFR
jgi:hypothetical protein